MCADDYLLMCLACKLSTEACSVLILSNGYSHILCRTGLRVNRVTRHCANSTFMLKCLMED